MKVSINFEKLCNEIADRQGRPWNNGRIAEFTNYPEIEKLFKIINSGNDLDVGFKGDLFRIHTPYTSIIERVNLDKETVVSDVCEDGSCSVVSKADYDNEMVSFSKSYDFTKPVFYKVYEDEICNFIHINTKDKYGIDINAIIDNERLVDEQEVLFPLSSKYVVKEYKGITPKQFKQIMDEKFKNQDAN